MPELILQGTSLAFEKILSQVGLPYGLASSLSEDYGNGARIFYLNQRIDASLLSFYMPCFFITHHSLLGDFLKIETARNDDVLMFSMPENAIFSARSFYVSFPAFCLKLSTRGSHTSVKDSSVAGSGIYIARIGNHWIASLPWDLNEWTHAMIYRPYYSHSSKKHFYEIGPRVDWGAFRRMLKEIILFACEKLSLTLYARKNWPVEKKYVSVRIDADGFSAGSTNRCLKIASRKRLRFDWFIDVGSWNGNYSQVKRLFDNGQSIGVHDFYHMTYKNYKNNLLNMRKGSHLLAKICGHKPAGVVSPFGYYYNAYQNAIKDLGFAFSSEFGYDTDNLPSHPHNNALYPLQIPVHPGSIGTLQRANFTDSEIIEHLYETALRQSSLDGFVVLYEHPVGRLEYYSDAYSLMLDELADKGLDFATMTELSSSWNSSTQEYSFVADADGGYQDEFVLPDVNKHSQQMASYSPCKQVNDCLCLFLFRSHLNSFRSYLRS